VGHAAHRALQPVKLSRCPASPCEADRVSQRATA
jgi:hypothetical protein